MSTVMVPIDGSECAIHALDYVLANRKKFEPLMLHLLNVQIPVGRGTVRLFIDDATIQNYYREEGEQAFAQARKALKAAGIPYSAHIKAGRIAETIVAMAKEYDCDEIVMGSRGLSASSGIWLGSVTTKTLHLAEVPVTVVK